ncbi:WXG100 family type VII secretion target [Micromonospora musae]|uniref:WXG100 family type VII secretion target n=1 Tax=Micromonospora musae TaxID=1894970 RepID=A0ABX9QS75_9ACTN|nr:WXG100 family type VII secretion target [Micromonospora musae]
MVSAIAVRAIRLRNNISALPRVRGEPCPYARFGSHTAGSAKWFTGVPERGSRHEARTSTEPFRGTVRVGGGNGERRSTRDRLTSRRDPRTRGSGNVATYHIVSEDIQESASWLQQNMQTLLDGMTQAKSKIDTLIQGGYNTPGAQQQFGPYFEEYKGSVDQTLHGMEGISQYLTQVSDAFTDTDTQTANSLSR